MKVKLLLAYKGVKTKFNTKVLKNIDIHYITMYNASEC